MRLTTSDYPAWCYPSLETVVEPLTPFAGPGGGAGDGGAVRVWEHIRHRAEDYLADYGRPEQVAAWREGKPYVAGLSETSAGR